MKPGLRRGLIGLVVAVALAGGAIAVVPPLLWADGVDYSQVASIKQTPQYQDTALLARAWTLPVAHEYKDGLEYQRNGSFCGPASLVNVLRSLHAQGDQTTILDGSGLRTVFGLLPGGVTLEELAELARLRTGRRVTVLRDLDLASFRDHLRRSNDPARRYSVNFHRGPLFGKGAGHHSPIGGYLEDQDLVLVLDVNAKYKPWLVKSERLFAAIDTVDKQTGKKRGLLLLE